MSGENSMGEMSRGLFGGNFLSGDFRGDVRGILRGGMSGGLFRENFWVGNFRGYVRGIL